jgi:hypothetical protein
VIKVSAKTHDGTAAINKALALAVFDGLKGAVNTPMNEVKRRLRGGYKSGNFVTGAVVNSVTASNPGIEGNVPTIRIGTNRDYALYWELGHNNAWTRRYERKEVWKPAMLATVDKTRRAFGRAVTHSLTKSLRLTEAEAKIVAQWGGVL